MQADANRVGPFYGHFVKSIAGLFLLGIIVLPLSGCSEQEGAGGGPIISSLSTPTEEPISADGGGEVNADSDTSNLSEDDNQAADLVANEAEGSEAVANLPDPDAGEDPEISLTSTPSGVTAKLSWDISSDPNVSGYHVYYGKQSSGEYGACSYEEGQTVEAPPATINGLEPNTPYFFAISAYGGEDGDLESPCSNEVLLVTPPAQT